MLQAHRVQQGWEKKLVRTVKNEGSENIRRSIKRERERVFVYAWKDYAFGKKKNIRVNAVFTLYAGHLISSHTPTKAINFVLVACLHTVAVKGFRGCDG